MRRKQRLTTRARLVIAAGVAGITVLLASPPAIYAMTRTNTVAEQPPATAKFYIVQAGPTGALPQLGQVAKETLGDERRWTELMKLNRGVEQPDGGHLDDSKRLRTGWLLKLPDDAAGKLVRSGLAVAPNPAAAAKSRKAAAAAAAARKSAAAAKAKAAKAVREARAARKARAAKAKRPTFQVPTTSGFVTRSVPQVVQAAPAAPASSGGMDRDGLTPRARVALEEVKAVFGVNNIGGFCPGGCKSGHISGSDHYTGRAIDIMLTPMNSYNRALGDTIASYLVANSQRLGAKYVIWNDMIWSTSRQAEGWRPYRHPSGNTSNDTLAHRDHVHLSVY